MKNIIIVGSGSRECAILMRLLEDIKGTNEFKFITIGTNKNPYMSTWSDLILVDNYNLETFVDLAVFNNEQFCNSVEFVVVGPEIPIVNGIVDWLGLRNIFTIAPSQKNARIESSKKFSRSFINVYVSPEYNPRFINLRDRLPDVNREELNKLVLDIKRQLGSDIVIKKDGLCGGKGVFVENEHFTLETISPLISNLVEYLKLDTSLNDIVVEEKLTGIEFSLMTIVDENANCVHLDPVFDYKRLEEGDMGPNTGSMGAVLLDSSRLNSVIGKDIIETAQNINKQTILNLNMINAESYKGVLYGSFILTPENKLYVIEFNCRMGDPEGILCIQNCKTSLMDIFCKLKSGQLDEINYESRNNNIVAVYLVPELYPDKPAPDANYNYDIYFKNRLAKINSELLFHKSHYRHPNLSIVYGDCFTEDSHIYSNKSRTLLLLASSSELYASYHLVYNNIADIVSNLKYRADIGNKFLTKYELAGVSIDNANTNILNVKDYIVKTYNERVVSDVGDFGGVYKLGNHKLVSSIDGVGTKTCFIDKFFNSWGYHGLGEDIVNHSINDILVMGARPLFFLDYYGANRLNSKQFEQFIKGVGVALKISSMETIPLIGGETAEMPSTYKTDKNDIVGCIIGELDDMFIKFPRQPRLGDNLLAFTSNGPHTNGFSIINKIDWNDAIKDIYKYSYILENLRAPHKSYYDVIKRLSKNYGNTAIIRMCHITGGGLEENLRRVIPSDLSINYNEAVLNEIYPEWCKEIESHANIEKSEMYRVFNCGIGFVIIVDDKIKSLMSEDTNISFFEIGVLNN